MKVSSLCQMADLLGYKVTLVPREEQVSGYEIND